MKFARIILFLLISSMAVAVLSSCGDKDKGNTGSESGLSSARRTNIGRFEDAERLFDESILYESDNASIDITKLNDGSFIALERVREAWVDEYNYSWSNYFIYITKISLIKGI